MRDNVRLESERSLQSKSAITSIFGLAVGRRMQEAPVLSVLLDANFAAAMDVVKQSRLFDPDWYLKSYPDVAAAGVDPIEHFVLHGAQELRSPGPSFDAGWYAGAYPDVNESGMDPLTHYLAIGIGEARRTMPEGVDYVVVESPAIAQSSSDAQALCALLPGVPLVESPFFEEFAEQIWSGETLAVARSLNRDGFAVIDFPDPELFAKIDGFKHDFQSQYDWAKWRAGELHDLRIQDGFSRDPRIADIAGNAQLRDLLKSLYGRAAFPFQTLNFAVGTQQELHSDHVHFNSAPDRFMCGVWLAFEDTDEENGPLFYYPGSHRWPSYGNEHVGVSGLDIKAGFPNYRKFVNLWQNLARVRKIEPQKFFAKKGQALIWSSNLVHGGSPLLDRNRTRWSQVTHYYFEGCGYYTPLATDAWQGDVFYRDVQDVATGKAVPNVISGRVVSSDTRRRLWSRSKSR